MTDLGALVDAMPFARALGVTLDTATPQEVRGRLAYSADHCTLGGALHGGAVMTLADSIGAVCAYLNIPEAARTTTLDSHSRFFRAVREGTLHAFSTPVHTGRTTITVHTDLTDDQGRRVAHTTQTQAVLAPPTDR